MKSYQLGFLSLGLSLLSACETVTDPNAALSALVKDFGYIGFQNPLNHTTTGTLIAGRPSAVAFVAPASDCFDSEAIQRHTDYTEYNRVYSYNFQGSLGFLASGNPIVSAGLGLTKNTYVKLEISGLTTEYMSSIDVTDWYQSGMSDTCKLYLDDVGFIIQALKADKLKISFYDKKGTQLSIDADNISQYLGFSIGTKWEIEDSTTVTISSPKYVGYQLGRLKLEDNGRTLWRAMSTKDDKYVFESISVFSDELQNAQAADDYVTPIKANLLTDKHSVYKH